MTKMKVKSLKKDRENSFHEGADLNSHWDKECVFDDPENYFHALRKDIDNARISVDLAVYIFAVDEVGQHFADSLQQAANRGVRVRLTIDGVGSSSGAELLARQLSAAGAQVRIYHPLPWYLNDYRWSIKPGDNFAKLKHFIASLNRRDHRKFCIIDQRIGWCGSFNICRNHIGTSPCWKDYAVRLKGMAVSYLTDNFDSIWFDRAPLVSTQLLASIRGNTSRRMRRHSNRLLAHKIATAKQRLWICNAYFSPSGIVIRAIKKASKRGIDVRIIVGGQSDIAVFPFLSATYYADLLAAGVSIYRYQAGILHAKAMLVDQQFLLGSTNLNHRSFYHDLELDVLLNKVETIRLAEHLLQQDMDHSQKLAADDIPVSLTNRIIGRLLRLVRYWM